MNARKTPAARSASCGSATVFHRRYFAYCAGLASNFASQTSAQTSQVRACCFEPSSMNRAFVSQISAHASSMRMCSASACLPPISMHADDRQQPMCRQMRIN